MKINTGTYSDINGSGGFAGWIEDEAKTWILFIDIDGKAIFYPSRGSDGGVEALPVRSA
jgi:hypothetical protein